MRLNRVVMGKATLMACALLWLAVGSAGADSDGELVLGRFAGRTVPPTTPGLERIEVWGRATLLGNFFAVTETDLSKLQIIGFDSDAGLPIATVPFTGTFMVDGGELTGEGDLTGLLDPVDENFPSFTFEFDFTGGTGDFAGATGSLSGVGAQTTVPGEDNDRTRAWFDGTLSLP